MTRLGFQEFLDSSHKGYIITSYKFPTDKNFDFQQFYTKLNERGMLVISCSKNHLLYWLTGTGTNEGVL